MFESTPEQRIVRDSDEVVEPDVLRGMANPVPVVQSDLDRRGERIDYERHDQRQHRQQEQVRPAVLAHEPDDAWLTQPTGHRRSVGQKGGLGHWACPFDEVMSTEGTL